MLKRAILLLPLSLALSAQEEPFPFDLPEPATLTRVAVGGYVQALSNGWGRWKGWTLEGTVYPAHGAPWTVSATGFDRPEGKGTLFSAGKVLLFGGASSALVALSAGTNTDILPRLRGDLDVRLDAGSGWKLDLAGALSRFADSQEVRILQAGPAYQGQGWSCSVRLQQLSYQPGGDTDTGGILNLRFGSSDFGTWHNLRLAAGRGILESTASGGGLSSSATVTASSYGSRYRWGGGMMGTPILPAGGAVSPPQERLASLTGHWPLTDRFALKAEATWGEKVSVYRLWGGSLQMVMTF